MAAAGTGAKRGNVDVRRRRAGQAAPPLPRFTATRLAPPPPAHAWSRRHPLGVVVEPAAGCIPPVLPVGGWSRLGASSRPQIGRWDRRQCHMPDFWVTGRSINPLNASVATFCAAGVISMHQTPPGMVRGSLGGDFPTISTGSHSECPPLLPLIAQLYDPLPCGIICLAFSFFYYPAFDPYCPSSFLWPFVVFLYVFQFFMPLCVLPFPYIPWRARGLNPAAGGQRPAASGQRPGAF
jgi:hypothetical protein